MSAREPPPLCSVIKKNRCEIKNAYPGIYYLIGYPAAYPIQIIVSSELDPEENRYIKSLQKEIDERTKENVINTAVVRDVDALIEFHRLLFSVNYKMYMEVMNMQAVLKRSLKPAEYEKYLEMADDIIVKWGLDKKYEKRIEAERREKERLIEAERQRAEAERREKEKAIEEARLLREQLMKYETV